MNNKIETSPQGLAPRLAAEDRMLRPHHEQRHAHNSHHHDKLNENEHKHNSENNFHAPSHPAGTRDKAAFATDSAFKPLIGWQKGVHEAFLREISRTVCSGVAFTTPIRRVRPG
jgi:ABC-type Zn2+ transport system substrate-binding protein/surface adhesin